jgi:hypothetical protein
MLILLYESIDRCFPRKCLRFCEWILFNFEIVIIRLELDEI